MLNPLEKAAIWGLGALLFADSIAEKLPILGTIRGIVLDTILGPEDEFDYVPFVRMPTSDSFDNK